RTSSGRMPTSLLGIAASSAASAAAIDLGRRQTGEAFDATVGGLFIDMAAGERDAGLRAHLIAVGELPVAAVAPANLGNVASAARGLRCAGLRRTACGHGGSESEQKQRGCELDHERFLAAGRSLKDTRRRFRWGR